MKVGDVYRHQYAGTVQVVSDVDEKHCRVNIVFYDKLSETVGKITEHNKLSAKSMMTLVKAL